MLVEFKNIRDIIEYSEKKFADNIAFKIKHKNGGKVTYDDVNYKRLSDEIKAFGKYLIKNDLQGKRIAVIGKNIYEWMLTYLSVLCSGGVIVPLDKGLLPYEVKEQLERSEADAVFYAEHMSECFEDVEGIKKVVLESEEFSDILKEGFSYRGIIYLENGDPRLAYEWMK